jgi:hypothetical protein
MPDFKLTRDPVPEQSARNRWPFNKMAVGDCAVFESDADFLRINRAAHQVGVNHGKKFTVRRCNDRRIRVWRLPDAALTTEDQVRARLAATLPA